MSGLNILVVGASIAGTSTAYWLSKIGAKATVIERWPEFRTGGQAVDIRTVGVAIMRRIPGMEEKVRDKGTKEEGVSFVRSDGRPYGVLRATGNADRQSLISEFEIYRGDLAQILFDLTKDDENVTYRFGEQVASMQSGSGDGPITVEFASGAASAEYDLVIACDGATSRTRAMGLNCGVRDYVHPTNIWTAYYSIKEDVNHASRIGVGFNAPGGRCITVGSDAETGGSRVMIMDVQPQSKRERILPFREALSEGNQALKQYIVQRYRGIGWISDQLLSGLMESDDLYASELVQVKLPSIYKGRFILVGDAGYAPGPTGGGTSLALAGAYILAGELGKHEGNIPAALRGYEQNMTPIIKEMSNIPPSFVWSFFCPQTAWGISLRNWIFAFISWTGIAEYAQRLFGGAFADTSAFPLPDYKWRR